VEARDETMNNDTVGELEQLRKRVDDLRGFL
jgi:hypothetical protein